MRRKRKNGNTTIKKMKNGRREEKNGKGKELSLPHLA